ncbi:MAG TPA: nitrate- and nitrite sensing domain-containing protein, partial [Actinospica sp.]|nr:nitrate- and nitrite sensing domain-containing protein [Actinospica sp.]
MRNRLFLLVCFPLVIAIGVAATRVNTLYADRSHDANVHFQATTVANVESLLLALQQERQAAAICLADDTGGACTSGNGGSDGDGAANYQQYVFAQQTTQTALNQLTASANTVANGSSYASTLRNAVIEAVGRTNDLPALHDVVTKHSAPFTVSFNAYTSVIDDVINVVDNAGAGASDQSVSQDENALSSLSQMIEAESQAAVITAQVITLKTAISPALVQAAQASTLQDALATYQSAGQSFQNTATPGLVQSFNTTVSGPEVAGSSAGSTAALTVLQSGSPSAAFQANSGNLTTAVLDDDLAVTLGDLRTVQTAAIEQMQNDAQSLLNGADNDLYLNIGVIIVALLLSFVGTVLVARSLTRPLSLLRAAALEIAATRLPEMVRRLRDADAATADADSRVEPIPITSSDEIGEVARSFDEVHQQAVRLASEQALLRANVNSMFVNLSRRSQSLVQRQLRLIDELENSEQDPDQLANLFKLDHLATRMRRNGENLLVLAGEEPGRKWSQAVRLLDVLRAGASEVEQYERVQLRDLPDTNVVGRVVNDLVHLVAELLENATSFSAPETRVTVTANTLNTGGVMLEIEDSGIGMTPEELDDANERLANPPVIDVAISRRMGLYVVGRLATRHGIQVRLRRSAGGGITALVLVPSSLLAGVENEKAPATELSATGVRSLGALPRRGAIGSEQFPAFAGEGLVDPLAGSMGGTRGGPGEQQYGADQAGRSLGQAIPGARSPMDEPGGMGLGAPPVGPPVNPFAAPRDPEPPANSAPSFAPEAPSLPTAPFGNDQPAQRPSALQQPSADSLPPFGGTPLPQQQPGPFGGASLPQRQGDPYGEFGGPQAPPQQPDPYGSAPVPQQQPDPYGSAPVPPQQPDPYGSAPAPQQQPGSFGGEAADYGRPPQQPANPFQAAPR